MSQLEDDLAFVPEQFSGRVRLFPLPNLVLYPHVVQPLHIFEPRYVEMLRDAMADDRLIAMSLLEPGWEHDYEGRPPIAPVACLGRVLSWQAQPGDRYNLLLLGLRRVKLLGELPPDRSFREAWVEVLEDHHPLVAAKGRRELHRTLAETFESLLPKIKDAEELFNHLSVNSISLGTLTDVIAYALDLDVRSKQQLLTETDVDSRAKLLLNHLLALKTDTRESPLPSGFPPAFSSN